MTTTIDGYPIDVVVSAKRSRKAEASKYPVERGTSTTDHVKVDEPVLDLECVVSDTPMGEVALHSTRAGVVGISSQTLDRLDAIQIAAQPVVVECSLGRFDGMTMTNMAVTRDVKSRRGLKFNVTFERIRVEDNNRTTIRSRVPTGDPNFGLSIDKLRGGSKILWRKGKPPGSGPADDPPGVIVGQEIVEAKNHNIFHKTGKALSNQESHDFLADMQRDAQLMELRALKRAQLKQESVGKRIEASQEILNKKTPAPKRVDPAMFGKRSLTTGLGRR